MEFEDIYNLYTRQSYNSILLQLRQNMEKQTDALTKLSSLLTYGDQEKLIEFPIEDFAREVLFILDSTKSENLAMLSSKCVFGLLEAHNRSTAALINNNALKILAKHLNNLKWYETAEFCIQALHIISKYRAIDISSQIGLDPLLNSIDSFQIIIQRNALTACENVTATDITQSMTNNIPKLLELSKNKDARIQKSAIKTINNIASRVSPEYVDPQITEMLCESASVFLDALVNLSTSKRHILKMIQSDIDFDKTFTEVKNSEKQMLILKLILNLLPPPRCLNQFNIPKHARPDESKDFAIKIQPILIKLLLENPFSLKYLLKCITATLSDQKIELTEELALVLKGFGKIPENSPFVLAILTFFEDSPILAQSHILDYLTPSEMLLKQQKGWFTRTLNKLRKKVSQNLKEAKNLDDCTIENIIDLISNKSISKFEFLTNGVKRLKDLFTQATSNGSNLLISYQNAQTLAKFLLSLLDIVDLPVIPDTHLVDQFLDDVSHASMVVPIEIPEQDEMGGIQYTKINRFETVGSIEYTYNRNVSEEKYGIESLESMLSSNSEIGSLFNLDDSLNNLTNDQLSFIFRVCDINYPRYHIEENKNQSLNEFGYSFSFNYPNENDTPSTTPTDSNKFNSNSSFFYIISKRNCLLSLVKGDCDPQPPFVPKKTFDSLSDLCGLLEELSKVTNFGQNDIFSRKIRNLLINPKESLYHSSIALDTIYMYPFLFPFNIRLLAFRLLALDPISAIRSWSKEFSINTDKLKEALKSEPMKINVRRKSLFNDGCKIFNELSANQMKFEISFYDEKGIGLGPTHEFFTLFSHELCRVERRLFRTEKLMPGIFCEDKNGMFFSPRATEKGASILGKFIAKSLQMQYLVDINFNPAIFKLVRQKEEVNVEEVDPEIARQLNNPEGLADIGLTFLYPGLNLPLVPGGENQEITKENCHEFADLVKEFTCGNRMEKIAKGFVNGFNSVFPFSYLDVFTPEELNRVIAGDEPQITREELEKNVEITHGYNSDSIQIKNFFDIISEMSKECQRKFIQFTTGSAQLPIGGLASLEPKITVAKKDPNDQGILDDPLPSCMTCMNYFKLPPYSTKEIMFDKIMTAISEGTTSFDLT